MTAYISFMDGTNRYTFNIVSAIWVLYSPTNDLLCSGGTCLGLTTNNLAEYRTIISLLIEAMANGVRQIRVYLDS